MKIGLFYPGSKFLAFFWVSALLVIGGWLALAKEPPPDPGPRPDYPTARATQTSTPVLFATGGNIRVGVVDTTPSSLFPLFCSSQLCQLVSQLAYPRLLGIDAQSANYQIGAPHGMALNMQSAEDGLTYTFTLRTDWLWSDGQPVTAFDLVYAWDAYQQDVFFSDNLDFNLNNISRVEAPDAHTLIVQLNEASCPVLESLYDLPFVPAHTLDSDLHSLELRAEDLYPEVTGGMFNFKGKNATGTLVELVANSSYPDAAQGVVIPSGLSVQAYATVAELLAAFADGEVDVLFGLDAAQVDAALDLTDAQRYEFPKNAWEYMGFNHADPLGEARDGQLVEQGHHPLFGDVKVRQAIAQAIDIDHILQTVFDGHAIRLSANLLPSSRALKADLLPIPYDQEGAEALLRAAGWIDEDGDGILKAHNALYAQDGAVFSFELIVPAHSAYRLEVAAQIQHDLQQVGIAMSIQPLDFSTFLDVLDSQTFDAYLLGWADQFPQNPDQPYWSTENDKPDEIGLNFGSYNNPEVTDLMNRARWLPGCDFRERIPYYQRIQEILQTDLPYVWLYARTDVYIARPELNGFDPYPHNLFWNADTWRIVP